MRIKQFKINSPFRNLKNLDLHFKNNGATIIIGNNGSGKSNIIEALSSVFYSLLNYRGDFEFFFVLQYEIRDVSIKIVNDSEGVKYLLNKDKIEYLSNEHLPSRIICNYSGEDERLWQGYFKEPYDNYLSAVRGNSIPSLRMVYVDKKYWSIALLTLLCCEDEIWSFNKFKRDILGINMIDNIHIDIDMNKLERWNANPVSLFIRGLHNRIRENSITIENVNPTKISAREFYNNLVAAYQVIENIDIFYNGGISSKMMSEGEKKLLMIELILEVIADENSLVMMDEPDSHIHVSRKSELKKIIDNVANRESLITTHSPSLTSTFEKEAIIMLDKNEDGTVKTVDKTKQEIVLTLTDNRWSLQEQNIFLNSTNDILLVEGKTDEIFLTKALEVLKKEADTPYSELEFEHLPCGGANGVLLLKDKFKPKKNQIIIAFFDGDQSGVKAVRKIFNDENIKVDEFGKARKNGYVWISFYPRCKNISNFNIEDYFNRRKFTKYILRIRSLDTIITKESLKASLANDCSNFLDKDFQKFKLIFNRILEIKQAEIEGKSRI